MDFTTKADRFLLEIEADGIVQRMLKFLPSTYYKYDPSTRYGVHFKALAQDLALLRAAAKVVVADTSILEVTFRILYRNFGYMLDFYRTVSSTVSYRDFLINLIEIYFLGSISTAVERGTELFSGFEAQVIDVVHLLGEMRLEDYQSSTNMPQKLLSQTDAEYSDEFYLNDQHGITLNQMFLGTILTSRDSFKFLVYLFIDKEEKELVPVDVLEDISTFIHIMKPAHTLFNIAMVFRDELEWASENALYMKGTMKGDEFFGFKIDIVLNPPPEVYTDTTREDGQELMNNPKDGLFASGPFIAENNLYFPPLNQFLPTNEEHPWKMVEDKAPLIVCFGWCETSCQASCEGDSCQIFCESAVQVCYSCQVACVLTCQELCMLHVESYTNLGPDETPCMVACQDALEYGACATFCEQNCQVGCELPCQAACQVSCQIHCVDVWEIAHANDDFPCLAVAQEPCEITWQRPDPCSIGCEVACQVDCLVSCEVGCEASCELICQSTCMTVTEQSCSVSNEGVPPACVEACQTSCELACESACEVACQESCQAPFQKTGTL